MYKRRIRRFVKHMQKTWEQKLYAIGLITIGALSAVLSDGDATMLILTSIFAVPMFFAKSNWLA